MKKLLLSCLLFTGCQHKETDEREYQIGLKSAEAGMVLRAPWDRTQQYELGYAEGAIKRADKGLPPAPTVSYSRSY